MPDAETYDPETLQQCKEHIVVVVVVGLVVVVVIAVVAVVVAVVVVAAAVVDVDVVVPSRCCSRLPSSLSH